MYIVVFFCPRSRLGKFHESRAVLLTRRWRIILRSCVYGTTILFGNTNTRRQGYYYDGRGGYAVFVVYHEYTTMGLPSLCCSRPWYHIFFVVDHKLLCVRKNSWRRGSYDTTMVFVLTAPTVDGSTLPKLIGRLCPLSIRPCNRLAGSVKPSASLSVNDHTWRGRGW